MSDIQTSEKAASTSESEGLVLQHVTKSFPGVIALDDVCFDARPGEVHGLVGENGAGKSTLMAIAAGNLAGDSGSVSICGQAVDRADPERVRELGLAIVRQHPALLPDLTVAENLLLGAGDRVTVRAGAVNAWAESVLRSWDGRLALDPRARVDSLTPEQRFILEISKALAWRPAVLVLDEPTEHLRADDVARLFDRIGALAAQGSAIVYISHRVHEVKRIADRITVLRDGVIQGTHDAADVTEADIIDLIAGRPLQAIFPPKGFDTGAPAAMSAEGLSGDGFAGVTMDVRRGEIVGLAGVEGNGQRDFLRALAGLGRSTGDVRVRGARAGTGGVRQARRAGIAYVPADRHQEGIVPELSVRANITMRDHRGHSSLGFIDRAREFADARRSAAEFGVKAPHLDTPAGSLSGGNQQKVVLSSVLATRPRVLLADEPTQGVDVGARTEIYRLLRSAAADGTAVIIVSADSLELAGLCDRVLVFSRGEVVAELTGDSVTEREITDRMLTATSERMSRPSAGRGVRWLAGQWGPLALLTVAIVALGLYTAGVNPDFLRPTSLSGILALTATLTLVACGQQLVMLTGGIDLSVGPLMGLIVVLSSFFLVDGASMLSQASGWTLLVVTAVAVGTINWMLVDLARLSPIVATLATYMALQAVSLILRPVPGGYISGQLIDMLTVRVGFVPLSLVAAAVVAVVLEYALLRTRHGIRLRATGSAAENAATAGVPVLRYRFAAYVGCSLLAAAAAVPLMTQVGSGDPAAGLSYMLSSIAAVAIGGASVFGGRGSFAGAFLGALLLNQVNAVTAFLQLDAAWNWYILGGALVAAAAGFSKSRGLVVAR
ncbi:hypothetical protein Sru01_34850 [Sphaerisporangium rufum]|uniref:ABC transporter domain-containing protein n=1 Tax=Sphaerisporangium rufum TaxID=1381558 RepID=A0A919R3Q4_9ACTN|nr:ATP-binding cassette domain-containing protein [Sphaerisporangium rufum]GII78503.1 hypothetical protein Sru01_34850 [Sphaerisporangium rufum]